MKNYIIQGMARDREQQLPHLDSCDLLDKWFLDIDSLISPSEDFYDSVSPSENIWKKFELLTPPLSPEREQDDLSVSDVSGPMNKSNCVDDWRTATNVLLEGKTNGLKSKLIQDCMWSGSDEEKARSNRSRKVSLSELTMQTASTSCVDPTTFSAYPRQQNQVEHSYSLTTPEPLRVSALCTPAATDDSESEEDVIDVVTVDTRTSSIPVGQTKNRVLSSHSKIQHDLQAVAQKLNESYKRPKCMSTDHDFALPNKKLRRYQQQSSTVLSSQNSSDSEDFEGRRSAHNVMERQRRNDLKNSLHSLRDCLPTLESHERAPKVVILAHATEYVKTLQKEDQACLNEYKELKMKNRMLQERLEYLQNHISLVEF